MEAPETEVVTLYVSRLYAAGVRARIPRVARRLELTLGAVTERAGVLTIKFKVELYGDRVAILGFRAAFNINSGDLPPFPG